MAVYFDHRIQAGYPTSHHDVSIHKTAPLMAVAAISDTGGSVNIYQEEAEALMGVNLQRPYKVMCLQWHPAKRVVATGWESGEILIWNESEHELYEAPQVHKNEITFVAWSSNGSRLLTADVQGLLVLWKADSRGRLQQSPICQHQQSEPLVTALLRPTAPADQAMDIASLARAAVSGDEAALDMFNWKKGKNTVKLSSASLGPQESLCFFVGGANGGIYYVNDSGKCSQCFTAEGQIRTLLFYDDKNTLVTITDTMMLSQHSVSPSGDTREILKVKLSGKSQEPQIIWAGKGLLATATGENIVRMWDLDKQDNYILTLDGQSGYDSSEIITCVAYCESKGVVAAGTGMGHIAMWKFSPNVTSPTGRVEPEDQWKLQPPCSVEGAIKYLTWGSTKNLLAVNTVDNVYILSEQIMSAAYWDQTAVVQTGPMELSVDLFENSVHHDLKTEIQIKAVVCTRDHIGILNGKKAVVYEITPDRGLIRAAGTFTTDSALICMYEQNIYMLEPGKVQVRTFQGTVKQLLNFTENEGDPICLRVCSQYLVVGTSKHHVKVYDLSRREAKQHCNSKNLGEVIDNIGSIQSVACNCNASRVSIITQQENGKPDPKIYVWDIDLDTVQFFSFATGHGEQDEFMTQEGETDMDVTEEERGKNQAAKDIAGRYPMSHLWDPTEPKLLVSEAKVQPREEKKEDPIKGRPSLTKPTMLETTEVMVVSLFITPENGILIQDSFAQGETHNSLMGLEVPYYYFIKKAEAAKKDKDENEMEKTNTPSSFSKMVARKTMRDFVGLESSDKSTRDAMMNFSYYLTIGNMDEAFKAIKLIKSESVWENMAKMCVKNRRLDVASVCLGNMGHARGAKSLREAHNEPELDARVAVLALMLGLHEDAERLLKNSKRYDMLNQFYQNSSHWGKAMETAEMYDRIHLRTTYFNYARHLEAKGDYSSAIPNYEKSETHRFEIPRMLFDDPQALENYIRRTKDKALHKWWAQYMESAGEMETALQFYEASEDYLSLVRVYCYCGNLEKGAEICNEKGDKAACYHMGRQYENNGQIKEAIHFFTRAGAFGNAIRLCKEHGFDDQMMNLALLGRPDDMIEAAQHYEYKPGCQDKAVMLYHKAGHFSKALDLAFNSKQFGALQMISEDLTDSTDPLLLQRCADFFTENGQFDRAVDLLAVGKKYWDALKICAEQHVPMTEELSEKLTPSKDVPAAEVDERNKILEGIAEVCMQQREYHIATKKYTQAGNRVKAMKALLKSGDTEKIVFFAGVSRQKEIYVMAANYLQSLDWRKDPEIMKNIIGFYTKGRALDLLAGFYDACSQVEIDEYQNYDKALGALSEAHKCLTKAKMKNQSLQEEKLADIKQRIMLIKKFVQARRTYDEDPEDAVKQCQVLLQEPNLEAAVRMGDVYGFMVEHFARKEKWKQAYNCMDDMKAKIPKVNLAYYVNPKTIEAVHRALDLPLTGVTSMNGHARENEAEEVDDDVVDDMYPNDEL